MAYTSKYTGEEIDAKLDEVKPVDIVDGLESDDSASALSARQGKVLKEMIEGGISEETEVYIGEEAPTDDGAKLWIDPTGTPSGGNGGNSGGISMYYFPDSLYGTNNYIFSDDEKVAFVEAIANVENTIFRIKSSNSGGQHIQFVVMNISETGSMFMATLGAETIVVEIGNLPSGGITGGFIVS